MQGRRCPRGTEEGYDCQHRGLVRTWWLDVLESEGVEVLGIADTAVDEGLQPEVPECRERKKASLIMPKAPLPTWTSSAPYAPHFPYL